jgi:hypothetical protein
MWLSGMAGIMVRDTMTASGFQPRITRTTRIGQGSFVSTGPNFSRIHSTQRQGRVNLCSRVNTAQRGRTVTQSGFIRVIRGLKIFCVSVWLPSASAPSIGMRQRAIALPTSPALRDLASARAAAGDACDLERPVSDSYVRRPHPDRAIMTTPVSVFLMRSPSAVAW